MKTKVLIFLLFATIIANAQNAIGIAVYQDAKLALMKDNHGNTPFTPDLTFKLVLEGEQQSIGHVQAGLTVEYAQLSSGDLTRFGAEGGYSFNVPFHNITPLIGWGKLSRGNGQVLDSWEFSVEQSFKITEYLNGMLLHRYTQRPEYGIWRYNFSVGLQFDIDTNYIKRQAEKGSRF